MGRVYATEQQLTDYGAPDGVVLPTGADAVWQLARASELVDLACAFAIYDTDTVTGLPTDTVVAGAMRDATCAQVVSWAENGRGPNAASGFQQVSIGSVNLTRASGNTFTDTRELAPEADTHLRLAGLRPGSIVHQ